MLTVYVVDDEYYSRVGIQQMVESIDSDFQVIGGAADAFQAIKELKETPADIVVTDIAMPDMDGIEMVENVRQFAPDTQFVIITGYSEFSYAKRALKLHVVDFLLKPIQTDELVAALFLAKERLERTETVSVMTSEQILREIMKKETPVEELHTFLPAHQPVVLCAFENQEYREDVQRAEDSQVLAAVRQAVEKIAGGEAVLVQPDFRMMAVLYSGPLSAGQLAEQVMEELEQTAPLVVTAYFTDSFLPAEFHGADERLQQLMADKFYQGNRQIISRIKPPSVPPSESEKQRLLADFQLAVKSRNRHDVTRRINQLFDYFQNAKISREEIQQELVAQLFFLQEKLRERQIDSPSAAIWEVVLQGHRLTQVKELFYHNVMRVMDQLLDYEFTHAEDPIARAVAFMRKNYDGDIGLEMVADHVHLNSSYLSRKLKETLGVSFTRYILELRMEKAMELLKEHRTVKEVAQSVGYENYRSFSAQFKQYTGYTPSQFTKNASQAALDGVLSDNEEESE